MALKYTLLQNKLSKTGNAPACIARTIHTGHLSIEDFYEEVAFGSTITVTDVRAVYEASNRVLQNYLARGYKVHTDFGTAFANVKGGFDDLSDQFRKNRNYLQACFVLSSSMQRSINELAAVEKVVIDEKRPLCYGITNMSRDISDSFLAGDLSKLTGTRLSFDRNDQAQGVFLLSIVDGSILRVHEYGDVTNSSITFKIPSNLVAGSYELSVRALMGSAIREGLLEAELVVA